MTKQSDKRVEEGPKYASFNNRVLASLVDSFLSAVVLYPVFSYMHTILSNADPEVFNQIMRRAAEQQTTLEDIEILHGYFQQSLMEFSLQILVIGAVIILFWLCKSATPGKMLMGMKIVDAKTLGKLTTGQCIARYLGYFVSVIPGFVGFFWILIDKKRQGFHDKIAGTVVIREEKPVVGLPPEASAKEDGQ